MKYDIVIHDAMMLTPDFETVEHFSLAVKDGRIARVAPAAELAEAEAAETIDGRGKLVMPGMVDAHMHSCQQLLRGSLADEFPMIWVRFLVPFEAALTEEDVYWSALLCFLQEIKAGVTTVADSGGRHMHKAVQAAAESGLRAAIARSMMDMGKNLPEGMLEKTEEAVENNDRLFAEFNGTAGGRIRIFYGMRQVMSCSPELIRRVAERARENNTGVHAHLCEHRDEVSFCLQNYKQRPAEFLESQGLLGPNLLTAHNVALSEKDITLLSKRQVKLVHCPFANLSNHGFPKTPRLLEAGCSVALGSDGAANSSLDLFGEMRVLRAAVQASQGLPVFDPKVLTVRETLKMVTAGGAAAVGLAGSLGCIKENYTADLILINLLQPHLYPSAGFTTTLLDCVCPGDVSDSIIDGKLIMRNRKVLTLDEEAIMKECAGRMKALIDTHLYID
jgi:5-methylthioadenosine/S-adenosylhomocysteine deaminase